MDSQVITNYFLMTLIFVLFSCKGSEHKVQEQAVDSPDATLESSKPQWISQVVRRVYQDSRGRFWFGTQNGAFLRSGDTLVHLDDIQDESGKQVTIKGIAEGRDGTLWIGHTGGISAVKEGVVRNYHASDGLISNDVWSIATDRQGHVWIGTIKGLCKFNGKTFTDFPLPKGELDTTLGISSKEMVHHILEDSKGTLWFSTNAGLFFYANETLEHVAEQGGIKTHFINGVFEDDQGVIWVSTKAALYKLKGRSAIDMTPDKFDIGKGIGSIAQDADGVIWFVANQHHLYYLDQNEPVEFLNPDQNKGPVIFEIYRDQSDRLWCVGFGGPSVWKQNALLKSRKMDPGSHVGFTDCSILTKIPPFEIY